jgi:hypothetical protein
MVQMHPRMGDGGVHHRLLRRASQLRPELQVLKTSPKHVILISLESWGDVHHPCDLGFHSRPLWRKKSEMEIYDVQSEFSQFMKLNAQINCLSHEDFKGTNKHKK